jgi:hypothetical protein
MGRDSGNSRRRSGRLRGPARGGRAPARPIAATGTPAHTAAPNCRRRGPDFRHRRGLPGLQRRLRRARARWHAALPVPHARRRQTLPGQGRLRWRVPGRCRRARGDRSGAARARLFPGPVLGVSHHVRLSPLSEPAPRSPRAGGARRTAVRNLRRLRPGSSGRQSVAAAITPSQCGSTGAEALGSGRGPPRSAGSAPPERSGEEAGIESATGGRVTIEADIDQVGKAGSGPSAAPRFPGTSRFAPKVEVRSSVGGG